MLKIYNTLTCSIEDFRPINPPNVGMYACGPTVYDFQHIGHMRRYVGDDILVRTLKFNDFSVKHVMNITDVGHLVSDQDSGEDKMEEGAKKYKMSVWDIAKKFENQFFSSAEKLNIERPDIIMKATDYIKDQIELIKILEEKGFTYKTSDGVYFDTSKFPSYGQLSTLEEVKEGARVEINPEKKNARDFALWKFSPKDKKREMEWESPWGTGFPGWHVECSTMSMLSLGPTLDIHTGGVDHISIHHQNEIAQSEGATGKKFVNFWVHHNFLLVDGQKMSKSLGNIFTIDDVIKKGFSPLALRYLYLQTHYRQEMNFTWESLEAAQNAFEKLKNEISGWENPAIGCAEYEERFLQAINDDLNMPRALAIVWELVKSDYPTGAKAESLFEMDKVLGLGLEKVTEVEKVSSVEKVPEEVAALIKEREELRKKKRYHLADQLRNKIKKMGYEIEDKDDKTEVTKLDKK